MNDKGKIETQTGAQFLPTYEQIQDMLEMEITKYCNNTSENDILDFIEKQRGKNKTNYGNRFIVIPNTRNTSMKEIMKASYLGKPKEYKEMLPNLEWKRVVKYPRNVKGKLGSVDDLEKQYEAIKYISELMLMANRNSKVFENIAKYWDKESRRIGKNQQVIHGKSWKNEMEKAQDAAETCYQMKSLAFCTLCTCLNVLNYNNSKNDPNFKFNYGMIQDNSEKNWTSVQAFVIDVPYIGQICIHLGSKGRNFRQLSEKICKQTRSVLESQIERQLKEKYGKKLTEKIEGGLSEEEAKKQIQVEFSQEFDKAKKDIADRFPKEEDQIALEKFKQYEGNLWETSSAIPLPYNEYERNKKAYWMKRNPTDSQIEELVNTKDQAGKRINPREVHYLAVKFGWNADCIQKADRICQEINNPQKSSEITEEQALKICQSSVRDTTTEQRRNVEQQNKRTKEGPNKR